MLSEYLLFLQVLFIFLPPPTLSHLLNFSSFFLYFFCFLLLLMLHYYIIIITIFILTMWYIRYNCSLNKLLHLVLSLWHLLRNYWEVSTHYWKFHIFLMYLVIFTLAMVMIFTKLRILVYWAFITKRGYFVHLPNMTVQIINYLWCTY